MKTKISKEALMELLQKKFPGCWFKDAVLFSQNYSTAIWSGEGSVIKGKPLLDAYTSSKKYTLEVHNDMNKFLEKHGWYAELYDTGTVMFYPNL